MRRLSAARPGIVQWKVDVVVALHKIAAVAERTQASESLREAIGILDALARENRLPPAQARWPLILRAGLKKLESAAAN
jgi:hypothetical protein